LDAGWLEMVDLGWLSTGWTQLSQNVSQLAGCDDVGLAHGWLDMIELGWLMG
jgi:hypothetical protein